MSYAYSFGHPEDAWNQKKLNSPLPCPDGIHCSRPICCYNVHPGEEGVKRKYFPGRSLTDREGKKVTQPPCVRLVGKEKADVPGYYRRRTAKMSWPDWCKQEGIVVPTQQVTAEQLIATVLPGWVPPSISSPMFRKTTPVPDVIAHFRLPGGQMAESYLSLVEDMPNDLERLCLYAQTISLAARWPQNDPLQPELRRADGILCNTITSSYAQEKAARLTALHAEIYCKVGRLLDAVKNDALHNDFWEESFTYQRATTMLLEGLGKNLEEIEQKGRELLANDAKFIGTVATCLVEYTTSLKASEPSCHTPRSR
jgi:hypothetical protein